MIIMKIPTKFELNTEDFKIYFDDKKKTHVCENLETGEKTNIGVLGIFMQMGVLRQTREDVGLEIAPLIERVNDLENRINSFTQTTQRVSKPIIKEIEKLTQEVKLPTKENIRKEEHSIKEHIMKKAIEKTEPEKKEKATDAVSESEQEIDDWMSI